MYKYLLIFIFIVFAACGEQKSASDETKLSNDLLNETVKKFDNTVKDEPKIIPDRFMYVNGYRMATNMLKDSLNFNIGYFVQGFVDGIKQSGMKIPIDSMDAVVAEFGKFMTDRMNERSNTEQIEMSVQQVKNLAEADSFLIVNAKQKDVVSLPSRLQYKILKEGDGPIPTSQDAVLVHMTSSFADGKIFDDTRGGNPRAIPNERMIPGWLEGITKMKVGSRWILYMHPTLAFGETGMKDKVPPNKLTIVDVELIKIMTPAEVEDYVKKNPPKPIIPGGSVKGF